MIEHNVDSLQYQLSNLTGACFTANAVENSYHRVLKGRYTDCRSATYNMHAGSHSRTRLKTARFSI